MRKPEANDRTALLERISALQDKVAELKADANLGGEESGEQIQARVSQARADTAARQQSAGGKAREIAEHAPDRWQQMCADAAAKARSFEDRLYRKHDELEARQAAGDAEVAESDALDALDFAWVAVERAEIAVLNAVDARGWADGTGRSQPERLRLGA